MNKERHLHAVENPQEPKKGRIAAFAGKVAAKMDAAASAMTENRVGSRANINRIMDAITNSKDKPGMLTDGAKMETTINHSGIAYIDRPDGTRRSLTHVVLAGETAIGVVTTARKDHQGHYSHDKADFLVLPLGLHKEKPLGGVNTAPVRSLASIDMKQLARQTDGRGASVPWIDVQVGRRISDIDDQHMSGVHAAFNLHADGRLRIEDMRTTNNTYVLDTNTIGYTYGLHGEDEIMVNDLYSQLKAEPHLWDPDLTGKNVVVAQ